MLRMILAVLLMTSLVTADVPWKWAITCMTGNQGEIVFSAGRIFNDGRSEVGVTAILYDEQNTNDHDPSIGLHVGTEMPIPVPVDDVKTYVGVAPMLETQDWKPVLMPFVAGILYPDREVSPFATWRYNIFLDGSINEQSIPKGTIVFGGLRFLF
jgi:hypothetical protein